jgi:hypothetical protein
MKCIRCGHDSKWKARQAAGGPCPNCKRHFAFEPKQGDKITDAAFANAIERCSGEGAVAFTAHHLYYAVARAVEARRRSGYLKALFSILIVGVIFSILIVQKSALPLPVLGGLIALLGPAWFFLFRTALFVGHDPTIQAEWLARWEKVHGPPKGLIARKPAAAAGDPRPAPAGPSVAQDLAPDLARYRQGLDLRQGHRHVAQDLAPDLARYSFDRAVICDRPETVDLLLANRFHFEHNCAVLSVDGYPAGPFPMVRDMLRRNPHLTVFALHDASVPGCRLARRLATDKAWFAGTGARIVDVGLRPAHVRKWRGLFQRPKTAFRPVAPGAISAEEARWLAKQELHLAAIPPPQLLQGLESAIRRAEAMALARPQAGPQPREKKEDKNDEVGIDIDDFPLTGDDADCGGFDGDGGFG